MRRRYRRGCVFPTPADFTVLSRDQKLRLMVRAETMERSTKARGKRDGALGQAGIVLLRTLLYVYHGANSGRCDPSYDTLQKRTGFCRATLARAIAMIEASGLVRVTRRMIRKRVPEGLRCVQTSNAYGFPSESGFRGEIKTDIDSNESQEACQPLPPALLAAMERLRAGIARKAQLLT